MPINMRGLSSTLSRHRTLSTFNTSSTPFSPSQRASRLASPLFTNKQRNQHSRPFTMTASNEKSSHGDFKSKEASRPPFNTDSNFTLHQTVNPSWTPGSGPNELHTPSSDAKHIPIDPYAEGRPVGNNYKLLISSVVPRPIAFVSTISKDGTSSNLAPFSYFTMVCHDPPIFVIGFSPAGPEKGGAKDTLANLKETGECVINIISEGFLEAANSTAINAPHGVSEWDISGLTPVYDCQTLHGKVPRVKEAVVSFEGKLDSVKEWQSKAKGKEGKLGGTMVTIEGTRVWVREDAVDEEGSIVDARVLRPVSRLGGITYGRVLEGMEIPRMDFGRDLGEEGYEKLKKGE